MVELVIKRYGDRRAAKPRRSSLPSQRSLTGVSTAAVAGRQPLSYGGSMRLTHLGHACVLVEVAGTRVLVDPGNYSGDFTRLTGLDAVVLTHQHADHADAERIPDLHAGNPDARWLAEPETAALLAEHSGGRLSSETLASGTAVRVGEVTLLPVGDLHAHNHDGVRRCGNTGVVLSAEGEPTLFHPGDAYDADPEGAVDILCVPLNAPWAAVRDTLEFIARIGPRVVVPVHDGLLNDQGRAAYLNHVATFAPAGTQLLDLSGRGPTEVS